MAKYFQALMTIGLVILVGAAKAQTPGVSAALESLAPLNPKRPVLETSWIRVKIFPHKHDYRPHGKDHDPTTIGFKAPRGCLVYPGHQKRAGKVYKSKSTDKRYHFWYDAKDLDQPVYLSCRGLVTVERADFLTSYQYTGGFYVRRNSDGAVEVVNLVDLETYLKGVVPSEVFVHWHPETLKSQAVAARTYSVFHLLTARRQRRRFWDVDDTVAYQAYTGVSHRSKPTDAAVAATRGQIITFGGSVIQAYYHANSGGETEYAHNVWGLDIPYLVGKKELYAEPKKVDKAWRVRFDLNQMSRALRSMGLMTAGQKLRSVYIPRNGRTTSGRVQFLKFKVSGQPSRRISVQRFRRILDSRKMKSSKFDLIYLGYGKYRVDGMGFGHGVGMSQRGAEYMAASLNWPYSNILKFYYTGVSICRLVKHDPLVKVEQTSQTSCYSPQAASLSEAEGLSPFYNIGVMGLPLGG